MTETVIQKPSVKFKTFHYQTGIQWAGQRSGILHSLNKPELRVASPPEFKGEAGVWTPEDMFVAALDTCLMTTFLAFAEREKLPVDSYKSEAEGTLEFIDGKYLFTKIVMKPVLVLAEPRFLDAEKVLHDAHRNCLISNSIKSEVLLEPVILLRVDGNG